MQSPCVTNGIPGFRLCIYLGTLVCLTMSFSLDALDNRQQGNYVS